MQVEKVTNRLVEKRHERGEHLMGIEPEFASIHNRAYSAAGNRRLFWGANGLGGFAFGFPVFRFHENEILPEKGVLCGFEPFSGPSRVATLEQPSTYNYFHLFSGRGDASESRPNSQPPVVSSSPICHASSHVQTLAPPSSKETTSGAFRAVSRQTTRIT